MNDIFIRTTALVGEENFLKIKKAHVVLCGCGGVGSYAFEALVRTGVGKITVIDNDVVTTSNINRQITATADSVGQYKTDVAGFRAKLINPDIDYVGIKEFLTDKNISDILPQNADFIIDAIDFVPAKVALAKYSEDAGIPLICCLGTGNRLDASAFSVKDIYSTSGCPLARKMRYELKKSGVKKLKVLVSDAPTVTPQAVFDNGKRTVGSIAFVPSVAGLLCAQHVILNILEK